MKRLSIFICGVMAAMTLWAQKKDHNFAVGKNLDLFNQIYKQLDLMYVDTLNPGEIIGYGINGMLRSLDPYTVYYPEENANELKQMITGKYAGIGALVRYHKQLKRVLIDEPYENMPSAEVGLKKGDIILSIDGKDMTEKNTSEVSSSLRGDAGTTFLLKVLRPSLNKDLQFKITRRNIKLPELPFYGMVDGKIGYISLTGFPEDCSKDMRKAFLDLKKRGAEKLILDLRNNGGGSLSEAVDIINLWIPQGQTIVETKGKLPQAYRKYSTRFEPVDTIMPLVVLVNGETASASEITCGAIQDLDRGIIIGTRTYGKGLVQTPIDLPYNANLKLTTSKYYIPSGRCIQAINYKRSGGGDYKERVPDSLTHVFKTRAGREVRDGGGIKPDVEVKPDTISNIVIYLDQIDSLEVTFDWVVDYIAKHPTIASPRNFELSDAEYNDYKQKVVDSGFTYDPISGEMIDKLEQALKFEGYYDDTKEEFAALKKKLKHNVAQDLEYHKDEIKRMLEQEIITAYYYKAGVIESTLKYDKEILEAVKILNDEKAYKELLQP
ncbi:MAG: S41 family peptidase [Prevotella sp.]|nr:S41 family peptidase [Prevotella sp.]